MRCCPSAVVHVAEPEDCSKVLKAAPELPRRTCAERAARVRQPCHRGRVGPRAVVNAPSRRSSRA
eukprot:7616540-Alexandrium_andersonii.AAC.1